MGTILHGNAKTTPKIRQEIRDSNLSNPELAKKYNLNIKTVRKWKNRDSLEDKPSGPIKVISSLTEIEQEIICEFRRVTKLPLDDVFVFLKDKIPALTRSNLHRCLQRNGLSRLPKEELSKIKKQKFKDYKIGFMHIDITQLHTAEGKGYLFVAIDRKTRYVYAELHEKMDVKTSIIFLKNLIKNVPFKIEKILTDNGAQFTYQLLAKHLQPQNKEHEFDTICRESNIEHRLTQFKHPWTNGLVERMNRSIKEATVKIYFYQTRKELSKHLKTWLLYYNHQKKLRALQYNSPYDTMIKEHKKCPSGFNQNPNHKTLGLNTYLTKLIVYFI